MGSAILEAVIAGGIFRASEILVIETDAARRAKFRKRGCTVSAEITDAANSKIILLAIKPQSLTAACQNFQTKNLVISILAGTPIAKLKRLTGSQKIVRVMPNTPASIGAGVSGWMATRAVTTAEKKTVQHILASFGTEIELPREKLLDAVTAISGSGPAYFFAFAEALEIAARKLGLGKNAKQFVAQTFLGAAKLAVHFGTDFKKLRENVTSKGGTTAAALKVLRKEKLARVVERAVKAAEQRSEELSGEE